MCLVTLFMFGVKENNMCFLRGLTRHKRAATVWMHLRCLLVSAAGFVVHRPCCGFFVVYVVVVVDGYFQKVH